MKNNQSVNERQDQWFGYKSHKCGGPFSKMFAAGAFSGKGQWGQAFGGGFGHRKAANIEETETEFKISLYAAGLVKSNFRISVSNDILSIAYDATQTEGADRKQYSHQEYAPGSFERSFQLNGKVLTDRLSATYVDGVLLVTLPKNPETNQPAQQVEVI
jgi:HSP20 family protein